jgi:hypothetical protein
MTGSILLATADAVVTGGLGGLAYRAGLRESRKRVKVIDAMLALRPGEGRQVVPGAPAPRPDHPPIPPGRREVITLNARAAWHIVCTCELAETSGIDQHVPEFYRARAVGCLVHDPVMADQYRVEHAKWVARLR